ncbi:MAG TPA: stage VI sporulation protein F [Bacillota bacterium]|nr:stage VI sporulation protein F [Bacillota bacterium]
MGNSHSRKSVFDNIQQKANIRPEEIYKVADSVKNADFTDEKTVRALVKQLATMANKPLSKEKENRIVQAITNNDVPLNMQSLNQFFKN